MRPSFPVPASWQREGLVGLPDDILENILSRLPVHDLLELSTVSRAWRDATGGLRQQARQADARGLPRALNGHERAEALALAERAEANLAAGICCLIRSEPPPPGARAGWRDPPSGRLQWDLAGRTLALHREQPDPDGGHCSIWLFEATSGALTLALSPRRGIACLAGARLDHLLCVDCSGERPQNVAKVALSPDGEGPSVWEGLVPLSSRSQVVCDRYLAGIDSQSRLRLAWCEGGRRPDVALGTSPPGEVPVVMFSPTGEHLALLAGERRACTLFSARSGRALFMLERVPWTSPNWDAGGTTFGGIDDDGDLRAWSLATGAGFVCPRPRRIECQEVSLSRGGRQALFVGLDGGVDALSLEPDGPSRQVLAEATGFSPPLRSWQWSPDGRLVAGPIESWRGARKVLRVTRSQDHAVVSEIALHPFFDWLMAWSPDSTKLALAPLNGELWPVQWPSLRIFSATTGELRAAVPEPPEPPHLIANSTRHRSYRQLAWSPDGARLAYLLADGAFGLASFVR